MPAPDCAAMTAFSFPPFGRLRPRHQTRPPGLPSRPGTLARPRQACARHPARPPATRHRAPGIHPGGSRAAARRPAGGRSRNVADGAPDRPAGADGSGPRGRGVACRTGANESGFRPGAATATWRRRVASGARPARGGAVGGRASVAHRGAAPRRPRLPPARQAGASNRPGAGPASHRQRLPGSATRAPRAGPGNGHLPGQYAVLAADLSAQAAVRAAAGAAGRAGAWRADAASTPGRGFHSWPGGRRRAWVRRPALARGLLPIVVELDMEMHSHPADWSRLRPWPEGMVSGACRRLRCG